MAAFAAHKSGLPELPDHRLKYVITANLDVGGSGGRLSSAQHDVFARSFQKVVHNLVRTTGQVSDASADGVCIGARTDDGCTVKVVQVGIDDRGMGHSRQVHRHGGVIQGRTVDPQAVQNDVIGGIARGHRHQVFDKAGAGGARQFQSD